MNNKTILSAAICLIAITALAAAEGGAIPPKDLGQFRLPRDQLAILAANNLTSFSLSSLFCNAASICHFSAKSDQDGKTYTIYMNRNRAEYNGMDDEAIEQQEIQSFLQDKIERIQYPDNETTVATISVQ